LDKKKRAFLVNFNTLLKKNENYTNTQSETLFADSSLNDLRKQNQYEKGRDDLVNVEVRYGEPLSDSLRLSLTSEASVHTIKNTANTFDFQSTTNDYTLSTISSPMPPCPTLPLIFPLPGYSSTKVNQRTHQLRARISQLQSPI